MTFAGDLNCVPRGAFNKHTAPDLAALGAEEGFGTMGDLGVVPTEESSSAE